jgi:UDP:flavonoid glycosyltransferase YjiC (YdhE family)
MRVLVATTAGYGHVLPVVPLAQAFAAAGHEVLWATGESTQPLVASAGIACAPAGLDAHSLAQLQAVLGPRAAALPPPDRAAMMFPALFAEGLAPKMAADLLPLATAFRPDLVVHEQGELAAPLVGAVLGVPVHTHAFGGAVPEAFVLAAGERVAPLWAAQGREVPLHAGCYQASYLDLCPAEVQSVHTGHIATPQPLRPVSWTGPGDDVDVPGDGDGDGTPLVYLTLGTVMSSAPVLRAAVQALAALPVRVLVTVGPAGDPAALGEQPANVRVARWVSQARVLPRCSVVVSHAGSGTFLGALALGLPQLCLPQAADQFRNAGGGVRSGAALALSPPEATGEAVAAAVERLLSDPTFRGAAQGVADSISAMPAPADVVELLTAR